MMLLCAVRSDKPAKPKVPYVSVSRESTTHSKARGGRAEGEQSTRARDTLVACTVLYYSTREEPEVVRPDISPVTLHPATLQQRSVRDQSAKLRLVREIKILSTHTVS